MRSIYNGQVGRRGRVNAQGKVEKGKPRDGGDLPVERYGRISTLPEVVVIWGTVTCATVSEAHVRRECIQARSPTVDWPSGATTCKDVVVAVSTYKKLPRQPAYRFGPMMFGRPYVTLLPTTL